MTGTMRIYADHHATTPLRPEVLDSMLPWLEGMAANPSSVHAPGRASRRAVEEARERVAAAIGASPDEIVFTSGGTESDNLAVRGAAAALRASERGRAVVGYTSVEHPAVREAARALSGEGFEAVELPVDGDGHPDEAAVEALLSPRLALLSCILAGNETGTVDEALPARAAGPRRVGALLHTDAVQAVGKIPVDVRLLGVDLLSLTAHKFGGPKGAGALFVRRSVALRPLNAGGGQEKGRRGGTENVAAVVGLGEAIRLATLDLASEGSRVGALRNRFEAGMAAALPGLSVNGAGGLRLPTVSSLVLPGAPAEAVVAALDLEGVAASAGAACASGTTTPSRVLLALGLPRAAVLSTVRFSFGRTTTGEEISRLVEVVPGVVRRAVAASS